MGPDRNMGLSVSGRHGAGGEVLPTATTTTQKGTSPPEEQRGNNKQLPPQQQDTATKKWLGREHLPAYSMPCGKQTHIPIPLPEFQNFQSDYL